MKANTRKKESSTMKTKTTKENSSIQTSASLEFNEKGKVEEEPCSSLKKKYVVSWVEHRKDGDEDYKNHGIVAIFDNEEDAEQGLLDDMVATIFDVGVGCYFDYRHISYTNADFWWYINEIAA